MSLLVRIGGQLVTLAPKTTIGLEWFNPLFDEEAVRGGYTMSFTLLLDAPTRQVFGYPDMIENTAELRRRFDDCDIEEKGYQLGRAGELRVRRIKPGNVEVAVTFGLSRLVGSLARPLSSFSLGGVRELPVTAEVDGFVVPAIVGHANDTVANPAEYDYVFAPLLNHYTEEQTTPPRLPLLLNPWTFYNQNILGMPAYGSFTYGFNLTIPGQIFTEGPILLYAPLPKLSFVVRSVLQELGVPATLPGLRGELAHLVLLVANGVTQSFSLADVVPFITLNELLDKLKKGLGLVGITNPDGRLQLELAEDLLASDDYEDWTHLAAPDFDDRDVPEVEGITLTYSVASGDEVAAAFFKAPDTIAEGAPVATVADLPTPTVLDVFFPPVEQIRFVTSTQEYYRSTVKLDLSPGAEKAVEVTWARNGSVYQPVPVLGGGGEREQGFSATAMGVLPNLYNTAVREDALIPALQEKPYLAGQPDADRSTSLRLGFYRGLQPYGIDPTHPMAADNPRYPLVTPFNLNAEQESVGELSLQLHGPNGTATQLLGRWLELLATATPVKRRFYLTPEHLANLKLGVKKRVAGNLYMVKQVSVSAPIEKAATVTLIPLPGG